MTPAAVTPCAYLVPEGFTGWVTIEYAVADAPPLPREGRARLLRIPADGRLAASSPQELGTVDLRFFVEHRDGRRSELDWPEGRPGADPGAAYQVHDHVVVLGLHVGTATDEHGQHQLEQFYVGVGPAGDPPDVGGA